MDNPNKKDKKKESKFVKYFRWPLIVLVLSFTLSMAFGVLSEVALDGANIAVAIIVIVVFLVIAIITDMIGVAVTACDEKNFRAMAARKVRGAKEAIMLQKNADRVSSIVADILGDICSILSGAAGAAVSSALIMQSMSDFVGIVIASLVSAVIAALLISGKAFMKRYSMNHADNIILFIGKILSIFHISKDKKDRNAKKTKKAKESAKSAKDKKSGKNSELKTKKTEENLSGDNSNENLEKPETSEEVASPQSGETKLQQETADKIE